MGNTQTNFAKALADIWGGVARYPIWLSLAWQDTKQRYRRSYLGPLWITVSTGVLVAAMGPLYGTLLGHGISDYIQHLAISLIVWFFISSAINESGAAFIGAEGFIKQVTLPLSVYIFRQITRGIIMFAHNALIIIVVLVFFPPASWGSIWLAPIGFLLVVANLFWIALFLAVVSARFRDIPQIVASVVQAMFFLSPVIWKAEMLGPTRRFIADFNPLYHFLEVVRAPLIGDPIHAINWVVTVGLFILGSTMSFVIFSRYRARIPYWI